MASSKRTAGNVSKAGKRSTDLYIVLLGKSGVGKSVLGNTILGREAFETRESSSSDPVTLASEMSSGRIRGKRLVVIDTPDLFGSQLTHDEQRREIATIISLSPSGPCVYILVFTVGEVGPGLEGMLTLIQKAFGEKAVDNTMGLITIEGMGKTDINLIINKASKRLPKILRNKFHLFFKDEQQSQVSNLLDKIEAVLENKRFGGDDPTINLNQDGSRLQATKTEREVQQKREKLKGELSFKGEMETGQDRTQDFSSYLNKWRQQEKVHTVDCVRLVLTGKTGVGKSATGNTILGNMEFKSYTSGQSVTKKCKKRKTMIGTRMVQVIDTPGLFDTIAKNESTREEIGKCITMSSPGPHVFLLLISLGRFTQEERDTVKMIQDTFGEYSKAYTMVGFTRGEDLEEEGRSIEEYIKTSPSALQELIADCGGRYHVFCNKKQATREQQVLSLLEKMDRMIQQNGGRFYTTAMFEETEARIRAREMRLLQKKLEDLVHANKEKKVSFLVNELSKLKLSLRKKTKNLTVVSVKDQDENMIWFEELLANLEKNQDKKISEIDSKILAELVSARDDIRKAAEKAEAQAVARGLKNWQCTIS